ncbi:hypothetical protein MKW92_010276 [Papaver armeniacum]|nr:hypothetical protein MKW92_010276 [Papaver armeniacum]
MCGFLFDKKVCLVGLLLFLSKVDSLSGTHICEFGEVRAATEENQAICRLLLSGFHTAVPWNQERVVGRSLFQ